MENCTGLKPILEDVDLNEPDPIRAIAKKYYHLPASVMTLNTRRLDSLRTLAAKFRPQCVIELVWQACLTYDIESFHVRKLVEEELHMPYLKSRRIIRHRIRRASPRVSKRCWKPSGRRRPIISRAASRIPSNTAKFSTSTRRTKLLRALIPEVWTNACCICNMNCPRQSPLIRLNCLSHSFIGQISAVSVNRRLFRNQPLKSICPTCNLFIPARKDGSGNSSWASRSTSAG